MFKQQLLTNLFVWAPTEPIATRLLFTTDNPFRFPSPGGLGRIFSSEYHDDTLGLVCYNQERIKKVDMCQKKT